MPPTAEIKPGNPLLVFLALIPLGILLVWMWNDACIVQKDPFFLFIGYPGANFFSVLGLIIVVIVAFYIQRKGKILFDSSIGNISTFPEMTKQNETHTASRSFNYFQKILNYGVAIFTIIVLIGSSYAIFRSLSLISVIIGIIIICYGIVRFLVRPKEILGLPFSMLIFCVVIPVELVGSYFVSPLFTPANLIPEIITQPWALGYALIFVLVLVISWVDTF